MMTVRCPNCEATYQLDAGKLANGGRKLRCAQCQTVWIATAEPEPVVEPLVFEEMAAVPEPVVVVPVKVENGGEEAAQGIAEVAAEPEDDMPPLNEAEIFVQRTPGLEAIVKVGGWHQWIRGDNLWRSGALVLIIFGVLAGAGVVWVKHRPKSVIVAKPAHEAAVIAEETKPVDEVVQPPKGVVLHKVRGEVTELAGDQGGVALTVRGLLANTTSASVVVPALRLELLGDDGKVADMWPVSNVSGTLAPLAEQAWTVSLTAPDMSSVKGWRVVFVAAK